MPACTADIERRSDGWWAVLLADGVERMKNGPYKTRARAIKRAALIEVAIELAAERAATK